MSNREFLLPPHLIDYYRNLGEVQISHYLIYIYFLASSTIQNRLLLFFSSGGLFTLYLFVSGVFFFFFVTGLFISLENCRFLILYFHLFVPKLEINLQKQFFF